MAVPGVREGVHVMMSSEMFGDLLDLFWLVSTALLFLFIHLRLIRIEDEVKEIRKTLR